MESSSSAPVVVVDSDAMTADLLTIGLRHALADYPVHGLSVEAEVEVELPRLRPSVAIVSCCFSNEYEGGKIHSGVEMIRQWSRRLPSTQWVLLMRRPSVYLLREAIAAGILCGVSKNARFTSLLEATRRAMLGEPYYCQESQRVLVNLAVDGCETLNDSEKGILRAISKGFEAKRIAVEVGLSLKSVHNYITGLRHKFGVESMVSLARCAEDRGLVSSPLAQSRLSVRQAERTNAGSPVAA